MTEQRCLHNLGLKNLIQLLTREEVHVINRAEIVVEKSHFISIKYHMVTIIPGKDSYRLRFSNKSKENEETERME